MNFNNVFIGITNRLMDDLEVPYEIKTEKVFIVDRWILVDKDTNGIVIKSFFAGKMLQYAGVAVQSYKKGKRDER